MSSCGHTNLYKIYMLMCPFKWMDFFLTQTWQLRLSFLLPCGLGTRPMVIWYGWLKLWEWGEFPNLSICWPPASWLVLVALSGALLIDCHSSAAVRVVYGWWPLTPREGIDWADIDWVDNAECLDLIEKVRRKRVWGGRGWGGRHTSWSIVCS